MSHGYACVVHVIWEYSAEFYHATCVCVCVCVQLMLQRMKEAELFKEWESQEDQVCLVNELSSYLISDL